VRNRGYVRNHVDADTQRSKCAHRRLAAGAGAFDFNIQILDALLDSSATNVVDLVACCDSELAECLAHVRFHPYTEYTPTSVDKLLPLLASVRDSGYAFASQMMEPRLCTLAVPVRDTAGNYVAGINVILQGRLVSRAEMAERYYQPLAHAAMELGSLLLP
jgi:DNA-binding IclR family transcriptional regulator